MNYNSIKNQEIKGKFVSREVIYGVNTFITELASKEEYQEELFDLCVSYDYEEASFCYIDNDISIVECMEWLIDRNSTSMMPYTGNAKDQLKRWLEVNEDELDEFVHEFNIDPDPIEIYEHWIVTEWFAKKLRDKGCIVKEFMNMTIWGRCTTGQAILLDHVISTICEDLEILEGQKNEWSI